MFLNSLQKQWGNKRPIPGFGLNGHELTHDLVLCYLLNRHSTAPMISGTYTGKEIDLGPNKLDSQSITSSLQPVQAPPGPVDFGTVPKWPDISSHTITVGGSQDLSKFEIQDQTLAAWIYIPSGAAVGSRAICTNKKSDNTTGWEYMYTIGAGSWSPFYTYVDDASRSLGGLTSLSFDKWYFLIMSYESSTITYREYNQGILTVTSVAGAGTGVITYGADQQFLIGADNVAPLVGSNMFLGSIMLWNRVLRSSEIWQLWTDPWCFIEQPNHFKFYVLGQTSIQSEFAASMALLQDSRPVTKIEFIDSSGTVTDISAYYDSGGNIEKIKERAPDEIHSGDFDITLFNHDDKFSEYKSSSLFYNTQYHGAAIRISQGFYNADGSVTYETQAIGYIDDLMASPDNSRVTLRCRDFIRELLDQQIHTFPTAEVPAFGGSNVGNGVCSQIETLPFKTVNEDWTLTCTLGGADGVATFSVVGSVSGNVGTATSGTQFSTGTGAGGIKFTINGGGTNWAINDAITFSSKQYPEWSTLNPVKIIWSILTGYKWDTNVQENFSALVLDFDNMRADANEDIDYDSFVKAIDEIDIVGLTLKGYAAYNQGAYTVIKDLLLLILGSIYTDTKGRIAISTYVPHFSDSYTNFSDTKKITTLGYNRSIDEVINRVTVNYKQRDSWEFSDIDVIFDGAYVGQTAASITKYGPLSASYDIRWYAGSNTQITDFATKLLDRFADPPLNIEFTTGMDALRTEIGDRVSITDTKYGFSVIQGEVAKISKHFDEEPRHIRMRLRRDGSVGTLWGFLGSSTTEADSLAPQTADWDSATANDKLFAYLSQTGGGGPDYRMF